MLSFQEEIARGLRVSRRDCKKEAGHKLGHEGGVDDGKSFRQGAKQENKRTLLEAHISGVV